MAFSHKVVGKILGDKKSKNKEKEYEYKKGDECWNCEETIKDPKKHYPICASAFCKKDE